MLILREGTLRILILSEDDLIFIKKTEDLEKMTKGMRFDILCIPEDWENDYEDMEAWEHLKPKLFVGNNLRGDIKFCCLYVEPPFFRQVAAFSAIRLFDIRFSIC